MATIVARTDFSQVQQTGITTYTISLVQAATAGNKLVLVAWGGARVTAKITNSSGTPFTLRTEALGNQSVSIQDFTAVGGETAVFVTLNGPENFAVTVYEFNGLGAFIAGSNNGIGATNAQVSDYQASPSSSINLGANTNALLVGAWSATAIFSQNPFNAGNQWRQVGPLGKLYVNAAVQQGTGSPFIYSTALADVTNTNRYPLNLANPGDYRMTSVFGATNTCYAAQAAYADSSGIATNPAFANANAAENSLPGTNQNNWFGGNNGTNATIAGYTDKTSYLPGDTVNFKVDSNGGPFRVEIYRLGYYGYESFGARLQTGNGSGYITGTVTAQPAPSVDSTLGSTSCNWTTNATWSIPATAVPGVYYVLFRHTDAMTNFATGHFVVRSSSAKGKVAIVIPDMTHQAYNVWGATTDHGPLNGGSWSGRSLYQSGTDGAAENFAHRAYAVSFDRPYGTQSMQDNTYLFDSEYGLEIFLEAQGYDLTYYSDVDLENNPTLLNNAALVIVNGHHEYWTKNAYDCLTNAANAGVNMMFNSSNTAGWHTRFAANDTNKRTMICYKDSSTQDVSAGWSGTGFDPVSYTGSWRDSRTGGNVNNTDIRRENALTGQLFMFSAPVALDMTVPFAQKTLPIWRNSSGVQALTTGQTYTTPIAVVGQELDAPDGSTGQPSNLVNLCPTPTGTLPSGANAAGTIYNTSTSTTAGFTLYRRSSGALIFQTGSWRGWWSVSRWRQDGVSISPTVDVNWQNALLAILYDLGVAPTAARELEPAVDTVLTNPAIGAPAGGRSGVALAYGLRAPEDGNFTPFIGM